VKRRWIIVVVVLASAIGILLWKRRQPARSEPDTAQQTMPTPPRDVPGTPEIRPPPPTQPERPSSPWRHLANRLFPDEQPIAGKVVDGEGRPIGGADVGFGPDDSIFFVFADRSHIAGVTVSETDGSFRIPRVVGEDPQRVWARAPGFAMGERVARPGERDVIIRLSAQSILRGVVVDDRGAMSAFRLQVAPSKLSDQEMVGRFLTVDRPPLTENPNGQFEVTGLAAGTYDIIVETDDKRAGRQSGISLREGEVRDGIRISVDEGSSVTGKVVDYVSGEPVSTAKASIMGRFSERRSILRADGTFEINGLPPLPLQLMVMDDAHLVDWRWVIISDVRAHIDVGVIRLLRKDDEPSQYGGQTGIDVYNLHGRNLVLNVLPDTAASFAGVQIGDEIVAINGRDVSGVGSWSVLMLLRGASYSTVDVSLQSTAGKRTVKLVRMPLLP
jgi:PDZ domain-containing protein